MSCETTETKQADIEPAYPEIDFPSFPAPENVLFLEAGTEIVYPSGETTELESDHVYMPLSYWLQITDYVIDVRRARDTYKAFAEEQ